MNQNAKIAFYFFPDFSYMWTKLLAKIAQHCWFNILLISASLNKDKESVSENNDVDPTIERLRNENEDKTKTRMTQSFNQYSENETKIWRQNIPNQ